MLKTLIAGLTVLLLAGCAASGPKFSQVKEAIPPVPEGKARVYFYRHDSSFGGAVTSDVRMGNDVVGRSVRGSFFFVDRDPGTHDVRTRTEWEHKYPLTVASGQTRYVRSKVTMGLFVGHVVVEEEPEAKALQEMQNLAYIGLPLNGLPSAPSSSGTVAPAPGVGAAVIGQPQTMPVEPKPGAKLGTWSFEVEKQAKAKGCIGNGAWLIDKQDTVETYKVDCQGGASYVAKCSASSCHAEK